MDPFYLVDYFSYDNYNRSHANLLKNAMLTYNTGLYTNT